MFKLFLILSLNLVMLIQYSEAVCGVCNVNNGVACINETTFHPCFRGLPNTDLIFQCPNQNEICTRHGVVCMDKTLVTGVLPACGDTSKCGNCDNVPNGSFSCTSRTTFTMCMDGELTGTRGVCPRHRMCDVALGADGRNPCIPDCNEPTMSICDLKDPIDEMTTTESPTTTTTNAVPTATTTTEAPNTITTTEAPITPTTTKAPTTTTTVVPTNILCSQQSAAGRYPHPNDTSCRSYVYCYPKDNVMQATPMICPGQLFFNPSTSVCDAAKPQSCI